MYAGMSGSVAGLLSTFEYTSLLVCFIGGRVIFKETQKPIQYVGCFITVVSMILITISEKLTELLSTQDTKPGINNDGDVEKINMEIIYISILLHCFTGIMFGTFQIMIKYANFYFKVSEYEFIIVVMTLSSAIGATIFMIAAPDISEIFSTKLFTKNYL